MNDGNWYLRAQKQFTEWSKDMVGIAVTDESIRMMLTLFVGPPPDPKLWRSLIKFYVNDGKLEWTGEFMPTHSGKKVTKLYEVKK